MLQLPCCNCSTEALRHWTQYHTELVVLWTPEPSLLCTPDSPPWPQSPWNSNSVPFCGFILGSLTASQIPMSHIPLPVLQWVCLCPRHQYHYCPRCQKCHLPTSNCALRLISMVIAWVSTHRIAGPTITRKWPTSQIQCQGIYSAISSTVEDKEIGWILAAIASENPCYCGHSQNWLLKMSASLVNTDLLW
jgi:hypothetical protein